MNRMSKTEIPAASGTNITSNASAISTAASSSTAQRTFLSKYRLHKKFVAAARVLLLVVFLSVWELTASHQIIDSFIFSSPSKIARCFLDMVADRSIFLHTVEAEGIREDCVWQLNLGLEQLGAVMLGGGEAEVKAQLTVELLVFQPMQEAVVTSVQTQPFDLKRWEQQPGIVGYIVQPGDSLWKIAKKFHTTVDQVREMNEIDGEEAGAGARLLLIKEVTAGNCS